MNTPVTCTVLLLCRQSPFAQALAADPVSHIAVGPVQAIRRVVALGFYPGENWPSEFREMNNEEDQEIIDGLPVNRVNLFSTGCGVCGG